MITRYRSFFIKYKLSESLKKKMLENRINLFALFYKIVVIMYNTLYITDYEYNNFLQL